MLLRFDLLADRKRGRVIVCGDANLVIRQMRGEIDCKAPGLQLLRHKAMERFRSWPIFEFIRVKRDWNQSEDRLTSVYMQKEKGRVVVTEADQQDLITLNRLDELLTPRSTEDVIKVAALTRSAARRRQDP